MMMIAAVYQRMAKMTKKMEFLERDSLGLSFEGLICYWASRYMLLFNGDCLV